MPVARPGVTASITTSGAMRQWFSSSHGRKLVIRACNHRYPAGNRRYPSCNHRYLACNHRHPACSPAYPDRSPTSPRLRPPCLPQPYACTLCIQAATLPPRGPRLVGMGHHVAFGQAQRHPDRAPLEAALANELHVPHLRHRNSNMRPLAWRAPEGGAGYLRGSWLGEGRLSRGVYVS